MAGELNDFRWSGAPGHYEVYYVTLTDPSTGVGVWIRYTMMAPRAGTGDPATASLWFLVMDPAPGGAPIVARKVDFPVAELRASSNPFELRIAGATLRDSGMAGQVGDAAWDLRWRSESRGYEHVHPVLQRARVAQTILNLPHPDLRIAGKISFAGRELKLAGAPGAQAHLWGTKHAASWAWVHCNDFTSAAGDSVPGAFIDGVSVIVSRFGRTVGPSTPVVGRLEDVDFKSTSLVRVLANPSVFALTGWHFQATDGRRKIVGQVDAERRLAAGVTYHDPDGELAYCYNSETASMRLQILHRARRVGGWAHAGTLVSRGRTHFEYAQRSPLPGLQLLTE
ncbi:MAG: hypothetical protein ACYC91_13860 [Solirubrobacteraceae bacterium]